MNKFQLIFLYKVFLGHFYNQFNRKKRINESKDEHKLNIFGKKEKENNDNNNFALGRCQLQYIFNFKIKGKIQNFELKF